MNYNKFFLVLATLFILQMPIKAQSIYQLPNSGFETWYRETDKSGSIVPTNFNSYYSGVTVGLTSLGVAQRCDSSRDVRSNAIGVYSIRLFSSTTMGVRANGNITTGRINMGSITPSHVDNYNFTDYTTNAPKHYQEISGTPDSMRFWVKYLPGRNGETNTTDKGRIRAYIHGTGECRDAPVFPDGKTETDYYYGKAVKEFYKEDGGWNCYQVPFEYTGNNTQRNANNNYYVLVSMTTNATPGGGANNADQVWFDDIEFIYSPWLSDLKINGTTIDGFEKEIFDYAGVQLTGIPPYDFPYGTEDFTYTLARNSASVEITNIEGPNGDADGGYTSFLVTAIDGISTYEYKIHYSSNSSTDNSIISLGYSLDGINSIPVTGFSSSILNYTINFTNPEEARIPQIREEDIVLSDPNATIYNIIQPTSMNSVGSIKVRAEDYSLKTYTISFSKIVSTDSTLSALEIGGIALPDFDPDTLVYNYNVTTCVASNDDIPVVTWVASSPWANINYTQATTSTKIATLEVTAENGSKRTYTITFEFKNNDATILGYKMNSSSQNNVLKDSNVHTYHTSFTTARTFSAPNAEQKGCAGSTIQFPVTVVYSPDTNKIIVTAQDGITKQEYGVIIKNKNCYLKTGANNAIKYNYNGLVDQNSGIDITNTNNGNTDTFTTTTITLPVGPNVSPELVVYGLTAAANAAPPTVHIIQPTHRNDTAIVTLTANDGITSKTYRVPFKATLSTDATLSSITYNGNPVMGFTSNIENYTITLPSNVSGVPEIAVTPNFQWLDEGNISITPAVSLLDTTKITVIAEDGIATKTYSIAFDVADAFLLSIEYDNVAIPGFNSKVYSYTVDIPYSTTTPPQISATTNSATTIALYEQATTLPYQGKVYLLSESMTVIKTYIVNFNLVKSIDTTLVDLQVNGVSLSDFTPQTFSYNVVLPYTDLTTAPEVSATPTYSFATADITQIDTVVGTAVVEVTAEDENHTAIYTINFTREPSPITAIDTIKYSYNNQSYSYAVSGNETEITINLPVETEAMPSITDITLADNRAEFLINEQPNTSNTLTGTVNVTAEDLTEVSYSIIFERTKSASTLLTGITYNGITIENFHADTLTYYVNLPFETEQKPEVAATANWKNTGIQYTQATHVFGQAQVRVTSEDGNNFVSYTIYFIREGNANIASLSYNLGGTSISILDFDVSTLEYNINLPIATTDIPELEYVLEDSRTQAAQNTLSSPNGQIQLTLITFDYADTLTYTVNFEVELSTEALLSDLRIDGVTIEDFDADVLNYFIRYEYGTEALPVISADATQPDARIEYTQINEYPEVALVKVFAGDTTINRTYSISFSVEAGDNNYLSEIAIDETALTEFKKDVLFYEIGLPFGTTELPVVTNATAEDQRATIDITNITQFGDTAKVEVTALNGDKRVYQLFFIIKKNDDALAKNIFINGEALENFNPTSRNYSYQLPADYPGLPLVTAELSDPNATYRIEVPNAIPGQVQVIVTAEDGENQFTYRINFTKEGVSITSFENKIEINVYPNPSSDNIYFEISKLQTGYLEIYSLEGKLTGKHILQEGINTISIADFSKGIYLYKIIDNRKIIGTGKFVKN